MPLSDHVDYTRHRSGGDRGRSRNMAQTKAARNRQGRRVGVPIDLNLNSKNVFSPLLSNLPSLSGVSSLRHMMPARTASSSTSSVGYSSSAKWQEADLGDGQGRRPLLLVTSPSCALQIFQVPQGEIPNHQHVKETIPPPEEVVSLPSVDYDSKTDRIILENGSMQGPIKPDGSKEGAICAHLMDDGPLYSIHGPIALLGVKTPFGREFGELALVTISLRTGNCLNRLQLGEGSSMEVTSSSRAIIVALSSLHPMIHILNPSTLQPLHSPLYQLPGGGPCDLPVFSFSGRLLAYATNDVPQNAGVDGMGTLVTAKASHRTRPSTSDGSLNRHARDQKDKSNTSDSQTAILSTAAEIGGGVAKGVWAGIKMGAKAANNARAGRLGSSAPSQAVDELNREELKAVEGSASNESSETGSMEASGSSTEPPIPIREGGKWIKIIDISPRPTPAPRPARKTRSQSFAFRARSTSSSHTRHTHATSSPVNSDLTHGPATIAHFKLPHARSLPVDPAILPSSVTSQTISKINFSPGGTHLCAAPADGRVAHIFEIHPNGTAISSQQQEIKGCVWHLYELKRGNTAAIVTEISWEKTGRWVGLGTSRGTVHIFPIDSLGGRPSAMSHTSVRPVNPSTLCPLSTVVTASARVRSRQHDHRDDKPPMGPGAFAFVNLRHHRLSKSTCLDLALHYPFANQLEIARLSVTAIEAPIQDKNTSSSTSRSALTEMMRNRPWRDASDVAVKKECVAAWDMPAALNTDDSNEAVTVDKPANQPLVSVPPVSSLARAEIQTHSINPRILPRSIYLSPQVDFYAARAIDEFNPLSILDREARTHRLVFRQEVLPRSAIASPDSATKEIFDAPLSSALHSFIESTPDTQLPRLPNGYPSKQHWHNAIPIRHVAHGLGEGVGKVRREYVRAQHSRQKRRASEVAANKLSFEDDVVFPTSLPNSLEQPIHHSSNEAGELGSPPDLLISRSLRHLELGSSPSSGIPADGTTKTDSSGEVDADGEALASLEEWNEQWEDEYARAVEDDGGPEELVLGLMDEEQEEREKWKRSREVMKKQWQGTM